MKKVKENELCPDCNSKRANRLESGKNPGTFCWHCDECGEFFSDNNGEISERFGYDPDEVAWIIQAVEQCTTANDLRTLLQRHRASELGINRRFRIITEEKFVEIDAEGMLHITPEGKALADDYKAWRGHPKAPNGSSYI